jgi:outer membrane protein assembly factor BamD (BamD/ComL family)
MKRKRGTFLLVVLVASTVLLPEAGAQNHGEEPAILEEGITAFRRSDFDTAILRFREVLLESPERETEATAYFWLAKSAMALRRLTEAERNLEYYLRTFPDHEFAVEARYQRGRLLFMQEDYSGAIAALNAFVERYPESPFVANAVYWSGESLFSLGRLENARSLFQTVVRDYPRSFRVEAARYRIELIDLNRREQELLRLLQWSHEEYLQTVDDFDRREQAYREAIASYQTRLQSTAPEDYRDEIASLSAQVRELQTTLQRREEELQRLREQLNSRAHADNR